MALIMTRYIIYSFIHLYVPPLGSELPEGRGFVLFIAVSPTSVIVPAI
jgi:hypothetical protein